MSRDDFETKIGIAQSVNKTFGDGESCQISWERLAEQAYRPGATGEVQQLTPPVIKLDESVTQMLESLLGKSCENRLHQKSDLLNKSAPSIAGARGNVEWTYRPKSQPDSVTPSWLERRMPSLLPDSCPLPQGDKCIPSLEWRRPSLLPDRCPLPQGDDLRPSLELPNPGAPTWPRIMPGVRPGSPRPDLLPYELPSFLKNLVR